MGDARWSGQVWIGRDWWGFEGASGDSRTHGHLCAQAELLAALTDRGELPTH